MLEKSFYNNVFVQQRMAEYEIKTKQKYLIANRCFSEDTRLSSKLKKISMKNRLQKHRQVKQYIFDA